MVRGSMLKYFSERGGPDHGGPLSWPGTAEGYPFRGPVPDLTQDEYDRIPLALDYRSQIFRLWDAEEKRQFDRVMDRIVNGWFMEHKRLDRWSDEHCAPVIWLEWVQIYGETPNDKTPSSPSIRREAPTSGESFPLGQAGAWPGADYP